MASRASSSLLSGGCRAKPMRVLRTAHADVEEFKALREYNEFLQKQLSAKEQRFVEQTDRLRKVQDELFTLKEANSDLKLELALKRCERKKCGDREPQNGY